MKKKIKTLKKIFLNLIQFRKNKYHPLTWISGKPKIGKGTYIGGLSEINSNKSEVVIGKNCDIASFVSINVADSHKDVLGKVKKFIVKK